MSETLSPSSNGAIQPALEAKNVTVRFGGITALSGVSLSVQARSIVGLVGPNGAGKSTMLGVLSGLQEANNGDVWLHGEDVTNASTQNRARQGLARTFQQPELFMGLTVREHLVLTYRVRHARNRLWRDMLDPRSVFLGSKTSAEHDRVEQLLNTLQLNEVANASVASLPLGTCRLIEVARALASDPSVILLDEPLSGLDMKASENVLSVLRRVVEESERDVSLLIVEHDVAAVFALASEVYVLDFGECIASGSSATVRNDPAVRSAYLGDLALQGRQSSSTEVLN